MGWCAGATASRRRLAPPTPSRARRGPSGGTWQVTVAGGTVHAGATLVNAAGAWGGRLARHLGEDVPLGFNAFLMMLANRLPPFVRQPGQRGVAR